MIKTRNLERPFSNVPILITMTPQKQSTIINRLLFSQRLLLRETVSFLLPGVSIFPRRSQGKHWDPRENKTNCFARVQAGIKRFVIHSEDEHGRQENDEHS